MDKPLDVTQALKDAENTLRDFIGLTLRSKFGNDWEEKCGVTETRLTHWKERKATEEKRQETGVVEERLIYYADFYDLKTILEKHWSDFSPALGDWKTMKVWLNELEKLRDPDAHRRELLPHQKHLILGIAGEIRTRLIRYRSKQETSEDYYPRIESVRDSLGNIWTPERSSLTNATLLRPGDTIEYVVTATDPLGDELEYHGHFDGEVFTWQSSNIVTLVVTNDHVGKIRHFNIRIRSKREYHAYGYADDQVTFTYEILPPKH
jgi:hypothetical protein